VEDGPESHVQKLRFIPCFFFEICFVFFFDFSQQLLYLGCKDRVRAQLRHGSRISNQVVKHDSLCRVIIFASQVSTLASLFPLSVVLSTSLFGLLFIGEQPSVLIQEDRLLLCTTFIYRFNVVFEIILHSFCQVRK